MRYKLRAECSRDIICFLAIAHTKISSINFKRWKDSPDCDLSFTSPLEIEEIKEMMRIIPDTHVMIETIKPAKNYSGERTYEEKI